MLKYQSSITILFFLFSCFSKIESILTKKDSLLYNNPFEESIELENYLNVFNRIKKFHSKIEDNSGYIEKFFETILCNSISNLDILIVEKYKNKFGFLLLFPAYVGLNLNKKQAYFNFMKKVLESSEFGFSELSNEELEYLYNFDEKNSSKCLKLFCEKMRSLFNERIAEGVSLLKKKHNNKVEKIADLVFKEFNSLFCSLDIEFADQSEKEKIKPYCDDFLRIVLRECINQPKITSFFSGKRKPYDCPISQSNKKTKN